MYVFAFKAREDGYTQWLVFPKVAAGVTAQLVRAVRLAGANRSTHAVATTKT